LITHCFVRCDCNTRTATKFDAEGVDNGERERVVEVTVDEE
jgi:hypothetical protein